MARLKPCPFKACCLLLPKQMNNPGKARLYHCSQDTVTFETALSMCQSAARLRCPLVRPLGDIGNPRNSRIHFLCRIEGADRESHATISLNGPKLGVHQRCAMQARASCNVVIHVEHDPDIARIDALQVHEDGGEVVFQAVAAVQLDAFDSPEAIHHSLRQLHLARMDTRNAVLVQPVLSGPQRRDTDHVRSAILESPGILVEVERIDGPHAGPAATDLLDFYMLANTEAADAHAPHERFVASKGNHIDVHLMHVDRNDAGGLSSIQDEGHVTPAADPSDLFDRLYRADHV